MARRRRLRFEGSRAKPEPMARATPMALDAPATRGSDVAARMA